jgi:N-acetyl-gamma-glutamyl-phosphate reductase
MTTGEALALYEAHYAGEPFVRVRREVPDIRSVAYTNFCDISVSVDSATNKLVILSVIDNLVKGAAGQALQNMNIMFGFPERHLLQ